MGSSQEDAGLLDMLASSLGCCCLSDLRAPSYHACLAARLRPIPPENYPLGQWNEAAAYLLDEEAVFPDPRQAKAHLLSRLGGVK